MINSLKMFVYSFKQPTPEDVNGLVHLSDEVLAIVIADAEKQLAAQLQSHLSTDQRGYAIAGLLSALATATMSGFFGLIEKSTPTNTVAIVVLMCGLWCAATFSVVSVWPRSFCFPGNEPKNWLPSTWPEDRPRTVKQAKLEQAKILQSQIPKNKVVAFRKAVLQIASLAIALASTALFGLLSA